MEEKLKKLNYAKRLVKVNMGITIDALDVSCMMIDPKAVGKCLIILDSGQPIMSCLNHADTEAGMIARLKDDTTDLMVFSRDPKAPAKPKI